MFWDLYVTVFSEAIHAHKGATLLVLVTLAYDYSFYSAEKC